MLDCILWVMPEVMLKKKWNNLRWTGERVWCVPKANKWVCVCVEPKIGYIAGICWCWWWLECFSRLVAEYNRVLCWGRHQYGAAELTSAFTKHFTGYRAHTRRFYLFPIAPIYLVHFGRVSIINIKNRAKLLF